LKYSHVSLASPKFNFSSYADDTILLNRISNFTITHNDEAEAQINEELHQIIERLVVNMGFFNAAKSKYMVFPYPIHILNTCFCNKQFVDNYNFL